MSTTRHHINRTRRLATTRQTVRTPPPGQSNRTVTSRTPKTRPVPRRGRGRLLLSALVLLTLALGAFAGWARAETRALAENPAARNTALTDPARTSEVKGAATKAVNALFSYDHAAPERHRKAASALLTGKAVERHRELLAPVLRQAKDQKSVVTTSVTDSAVERIDGDRARVLVFADQSSTGTAAKAKGGANYAGAMLAVDLVERDGRWLVSAIDTFTD
ncbi:hypothetical protein QIS99_08565 [Streptomyces sp. B-S-A8]|uniref:Mce-associated membrane protein n=1 Tax=Streptomyces solicavernae TaxID=3043614 RepID=A0ABT6RPC0_9ACTN|nr:hypothetical protein [Streptomyces sp. B-S-A8]MDI3386267.1 hypothetical protein [Streptomyces sp. B-S-A8]